MRIRVHTHPLASVAPLEFEAESLGEWMLARYGRRPKNVPQIFEGEPSLETEITGNVDAILHAAAPLYVVLETPGTPYPILNFIISYAINAAFAYMARPASRPLTSRAQESPNNQLAGRENKARVMERVEDIYGTVRAFPTLLMPTYRKYIDNRAVEYSYMCVGRGYHAIDDARDGDTPGAEIDGFSAAFYEPFTSPNSGDLPFEEIGDPIIGGIDNVSRNGSVDGVTLKPTNQLQITADLPYKFYAAGTGDGTLDAQVGDTLYQPEASRRPNFSAVSEVGQDIEIIMDPTSQTREGSITVDAANTYVSPAAGFFFGVVIGSTVTVSATFLDPSNAGSKTVAAVSSDGKELTVSETLVAEGPLTVSFDLMIDYSATRTIAEVGNAYVVLTGTSVFSPIYVPGVGPTAPQMNATLEVDNGLTDWTDWYTLPDTTRTELFTNVLAQNGMYRDDGAKSITSVEYEVEIEQLTSLLVPTGVVETITGTVSGASSDERAETLEQATAWTGPARVRMRRTTQFDYDFAGLINDEIKWVDLYSVSPETRTHFGNKTTVYAVTYATPRATSVRRRELNCLASRLLPTYNGTAWSGTFDADGAHATGTISATSKIIDIIGAVVADPKIGNGSLTADVDMAQLWTVQQALDAWNTECGQFNFTFDDDGLSFEETVMAIADAAFCKAYRQNGKLRLALNRPQSAAVALFTHRNKSPDPEAEEITRTFTSEWDGIELHYQDPDTEAQETIRLPLGGGYTRLKKIEVSGIRSFTQAWLRANREYQKLLYQRLAIVTRTTSDARALLPYSRVSIVDNTSFSAMDGEVVAQSGLTLTLSREVEFEPAAPHSIVLKKRDGGIQSIACTEVSGEPSQVLLGTTPAEALVTAQTPDDGMRTAFSFASDAAHAAGDWLVDEIDITDDEYVQVTAWNYTDEYYAADEEAIPDKATVIND